MFQENLFKSADNIVEPQQWADGGRFPCNPLCTLHNSAWQGQAPMSRGRGNPPRCWRRELQWLGVRIGWMDLIIFLKILIIFLIWIGETI